MTIYLIDYENVHDGGLKDSGNVPEDSKILLFFSNNEDKITMGNLMPIVSRLSLYKTRAGKQSLDMHLASYLGHEIGINGKEHKYVIVSKDHDYDNVAMYWKDQGIDVSVQGALVITEPEKDRQNQEQSQSRSRTQNNRNRNQNLSRIGRGRRQPENSAAEQPAQPVQFEVPAAAAPSTEAAMTEKDKAPAENTVSNNIISAEENIPVKELPEEEKKPEETTVPDTVTAEEISEKEKTPDKTVLQVVPAATEVTVEPLPSASVEAESPGTGETPKPAAAESVQEETPDHTGTASRRGNYQRRNNQNRNSQGRNSQGRNTQGRNTQGRNNRGSQDSQLPKEPSVQKNSGQQQTEKTMLNNKMMTKLTEAKLDAATVGKLTATIMKQFGKSNFRQLVYREIIKACGMQRGLEVYGLVKKIL